MNFAAGIFFGSRFETQDSYVLWIDLSMEYDIKAGQEIKADKRLGVLEIIGTATRGGMEIHIANFLKNLPPGKFRITCICPCESPFTQTLRELGVEAVYIAPLSDDPEWRSVQTAIEIAKLHKIDVFHAHMPKSHVLAGIAANLLNKPVVATVHGMHVTAHELGVARAVHSHLVTNCQETYIQALALGIDAGKVNLFHNGVDINRFKPGKDGGKFREQAGIPTDAPLVGFVARLEHEKGPDLFVRAADYVHAQLPGVHFAVVGSGSMLPQLEKMQKKMGLEKYLHFIDWSEDPSEVYPAFDLLGHSSRSDGTSLVLLEAMASGIPVVGMGVGGVREMISNEQTGMLVPAGDWEGLGWNMVNLLKQPDTLKQMGIAGRKRVTEHFNVATNTQKTANLLLHVAAMHKKSQHLKNTFDLPVQFDSNSPLKTINKKQAG